MRAVRNGIGVMMTGGRIVRLPVIVALLAAPVTAYAVTGDLIVIIVYYLINALTIVWVVALPIAVSVPATKKLSCFAACVVASGMTALAVVYGAHFIADWWFRGQFPQEPGNLWVWQMLYAAMSALGLYVAWKACLAIRQFNDTHQ